MSFDPRSCSARVVLWTCSSLPCSTANLSFQSMIRSTDLINSSGVVGMLKGFLPNCRSEFHTCSGVVLAILTGFLFNSQSESSKWSFARRFDQFRRCPLDIEDFCCPTIGQTCKFKLDLQILFPTSDIHSPCVVLSIPNG